VAEFEPAFSDEMLEQMVLDVYEHVKAGTLSKLKVIGVSREMIAKRDDEGDLVYYDIRVEGKEKPIVLDTMIGRIRIYIKDWKKYLAPLMEPLLLEAAYQHAVKSKESTASFKTAAEMIMPKVSADDGTKPAISPGVSAILQNNPVGTTIVIGQDSGIEGTGDKGHECADTVHLVADGCEGAGESAEDTPAEVVPPGNGGIVHEVHEGGDTTEGSALSYSEIPSEDSVDNYSGYDMGSD